MIWPFRKKVLVPISIHINEIIDNMKLDCQLHWDLWRYIHQKYGVERKYSRRDHINYLVFKNEQEYTLFLLRL